jgi:hypothetical protein
MPPTQIVRDIRTITQKQLLPQVTDKWLPQFNFGIRAYTLQEFTSATGNARMVSPNPNTASSKSRRLLSNSRLAEQMGTVFDSLGLVKPRSFVNIDHSDFNGLMALAGAVQTRKGRAIPCMVEVTYANRLTARDDAPPRKKALRAAWTEERKSRSLTGHTIDALQDFHDRLGFWPRLVFDRGFCNESIMTHLAAEGSTFYVRLKAGRFVEFGGQKTEVKALPDKDSTIQLFGLKLRVIRSPKNRKAEEPWYILTNDFSSSRNKIVGIYYRRFEIEETFRDEKHIFGLKRTRLNKPNSLKVILWLVSFGIALLYLATRGSPGQQAVHPKKQCSWVRQSFETLKRAHIQFLWSG